MHIQRYTPTCTVQMYSIHFFGVCIAVSVAHRSLKHFREHYPVHVVHVQ